MNNHKAEKTNAMRMLHFGGFGSGFKEGGEAFLLIIEETVENLDYIAIR